MIKVQILDKNVFRGIDPSKVEKYLKGNEWYEQRRLPNDVAIWFRQGEEGDIHRLWLPLDYQLADFTEMMSRVVGVVSQAEGRSQLQVFDDLNTAAIGDVIRSCSEDKLDRGSSSLPFLQGMSLIEQTKSMAVAAAMSELEEREVHPSARSREVNQFMENMRLGQTEPGSYVVKLVSPIGEVETGEDELPGMPPELPFERRAVMRLVTGLEALRDVAHETQRRGVFRLQPFQEVVPQGVSANLCEAVAAKGKDDDYGPVEISVTWSYVLPPQDGVRRAEVQLSVDQMPYIAEAARQFRERHPELRTIEGHVKVLSRDPGKADGKISLVVMIDDKQRVVRIELDVQDYQRAIRAHEQDFRARVEGELVQEGPFLSLRDPRNFRIIENLPLFPSD